MCERRRSGRGSATRAVVTALALSFSPTLGGGLALLETVLSDNGDHDGFADTNETVELRLRFQNTGGAPLSGVRARLATLTPDRVCLTTSLVDLGDFSIGEIKLGPPFVFHVLVDRTALALDGYAYLPATFNVLVNTADTTFPHLLTPSFAIDLDLDVSGGSGPTTFFESFESATLGAFEIENLDQGKHDLAASDGYRCQYHDPDWVEFPIEVDCYLGATLAQADAVFWGLSGPSFSPLAGRAFSGQHSLYFGVDLGPPQSWTTPLGTLEATRTSQPIPLDWNGGAPVLSIKHQTSLVDHRCFAPTGSADRAVVMVQMADAAGAPVGPWVKIYPFQNGYDQQHSSSAIGTCVFDPVDDGSTEDDFFDPTFPGRRFGPSSTCAPEYSFTDIGETSDLFDAGHVGHADGPGLAGFWGIGTWIESRFDLGRFRGRSVRLRFLASTLKGPDSSETWEETGAVTNPVGCDDGWWIDDVSVTGALTAPAVVAADTHDNSGLPGPPAGDGDTDSIFDACDNCAAQGNADQRDQDLDGLGDACDPCKTDHALLLNADADGDQVCSSDNCPATFNPDQIDGDSDDFGLGCDCADDDSRTYPGAPEFNDGLDNQCPGDPGHGVADEVSGTAGFFDPNDKNIFSWSPQQGASRYQVVRGSSADFSVGCALFTLPFGQTFFSTAGFPLPAGQIRFFLVRPLAPHMGSWGQRSSGAERSIPCAP